MARDILEELVTKFTYDVDQAGLNKYLRSQEKINRSTKTMIGLNTTLSRVMRRLFVGAGAILGVNSLVQTYRNFDLVQRSLNALTGSAEEGAEHFEFLRRAALQTGTGIMEVAKAYRGYYYAAKTAGLTNEELQHSFLGVMVGARVLGANKQQVGGAMLALEQMLNKTTVQAQELNLQLGNAISGAKEMAAEAMGMSVSEFVDKMQKKMINSAEFVKKFGDYMYKTFIDRLPEAMKSLDASIVNLQNAWLIFQHEIMKGGLGEELTKLTGQLMQVLLSPEAKAFAQAIGQALNMVGKALSFIVKHFRAILFLFGVATIMQVFTSLSALRYRILDIATTMNNGLSPAMDNIVAQLANMIFYGGGLKSVLGAIGKALVPFGKWALIIAAIAAALYGIYLLLEDIFTYINHPEWESFTKDLVEQFPIINDMIEDMKKTFSEMQPMFTELGRFFIETLREILKLCKELMPFLEVQLKVSLTTLMSIMWVLTKILGLINSIIEKFRMGKIKPPGFLGVSGNVEAIQVSNKIRKLHNFKKKGLDNLTPEEKILYDKYGSEIQDYFKKNPQGTGFLRGWGVPTNYPSNNLSKNQTENTNITNHNQITIQGTNLSLNQLTELVANVISGGIDALNKTIGNNEALG